LKATIIRFEGPYAICITEDNCIADIKRFKIPMEAEEGDILNIEDPSVTVENQTQEEYIHVDDVILDWWHDKNKLT
jgi:hypothetical protein